MASSTTNLNLTKPTTSENFNLSVINGNWDKIDTGWGTLNSKIFDISFSGTTDANGFVFSTYSRDNYRLLGATIYGAIAIPYVGNGTSEGGLLGVKALSTTMNAVANTSVTVQMFLMRR